MKQEPSKLRIIVLAGGISDERAVSLRSGAAVTEALKVAGHDTVLYDLTSHEVTPDIFEGFDLTFPVLHGKGGEDGMLQAQLDQFGVKYVGSGRIASELCFEKWNFRKFLEQHGFPVAQGELVNSDSVWQSTLITQPFILKPNDGGSSIDIYVARDPANITKSVIDDLFTRYDMMLIEELVTGDELTIGVLDTVPLTVVEIIPPYGGEFDYENKYNGATQELCPPEHVSVEIQQTAQELALKIHQQTGCRHYSRTDMMVRPDGSLIVLETNTLPGMTDQSLFPKAAEASGITMPELADQLARMALTD